MIFQDFFELQIKFSNEKLIFLNFISAQVTWRNLERPIDRVDDVAWRNVRRPIAQLNRDGRSSLKVWEYVA